MKNAKVVLLFVSGMLLAGSSMLAAQSKNIAVKANEGKVTFVELGSVNCIPCKAMQSVMKEIENEYGDQVKVVFHDVWTAEGKPFGEQYKIRAIPTQVFLDKNGKEYFRHEGFFPTGEIAKVLDKQGIKPVKNSKTSNTGTKMQSGEVCK